jgi:spermidine/putrescine transport system ATP-binding protein
VAAERDFIRIGNLSKRFGATLAVDRVTLDISRGEFFSLLGPSGCGKTTLLRMVGGFTAPDTGTVVIDGEDVTATPPNRRPTNMVFQSYAIFPHLNVRDNIAYGLKPEGLSRVERDKRVTEALNLIALQGYDERRPHQLSGGERQRVALARALVKRPKVLLLDEPLGALDKRLREAMQIELRQLQREVGITFLFVTHDQEEALAMSDQIAVMDKGRVLQVADPKTLYETPNSRAVAEFIGTMNFFEARLIGIGQGKIMLEAETLGRLEVAPPQRVTYTPGMRLVAAIRPEKLLLSHEPPSGPSLRGRVLSAAYFGDRSHFQLAIKDRKTPLTVAAQMNAKPGDNLYLSWQPDSFLLLPA